MVKRSAAAAIWTWWVASAVGLYIAAPYDVPAPLWVWFWTLVASGTFVIGVAARTLWRL